MAFLALTLLGCLSPRQAELEARIEALEERVQLRKREVRALTKRLESE